jgi:hypothetical protein
LEQHPVNQDKDNAQSVRRLDKSKAIIIKRNGNQLSQAVPNINSKKNSNKNTKLESPPAVTKTYPLKELFANYQPW